MEGGCADGFRLRAITNGPAVEDFPEKYLRRPLADKGENRWRVAQNSGLQSLGVIRARGQRGIAAGDIFRQISETDSEVKRIPEMLRLDQTGRQAGLMEDAPEFIARPREIGPLAGRDGTHRAAAEDHTQAGREQIGQNRLGSWVRAQAAHRISSRPQISVSALTSLAMSSSL